MEQSARIELDTIVEGVRLSPRLTAILVIAALALVSDGFDVAAMGLIAPELAKEWGIGPAGMVPAFSAGIVGMMIGGPLLGLIGDRFGRKRAVLAGLALIGAATLATMSVRSVTDLVILRLLTGIGLGGVIPNMIALVAEIMPHRIRGRVLVVVILGMVCGTSLPGLVAALLVPKFGWQAIVVVGGVLPLLVTLAVALWTPESLKFLIGRGSREAEARQVAKLLRPDLAVNPATVIGLPAGAPVTQPKARELFRGDFRVVTPLLWICQATNQMSNFFALTWLPTLLQAQGASSSHAGAVASLFALGGLVGGLILMNLLDRWGAIPMAVLFVLGAPLVAMMAGSHDSAMTRAVIIAGAGLCVTGINIALTALLGLFHPTPIRALGIGWTQSAGRLGALAAPLVGGLLLSMKIPLQDLPLAPAIVLGIGAVACIALAAISLRQFGSARPGEFRAA